MADIVIPPFEPSVVISENDLIADTDDKIITIMGEAGTYLQTQTQNASDTINSNVNKIFTATFQGTVGQTTTNLISGLITGGQTISINCLVISANGILGRITEINDPNVIILWLQEITTTSIYKLVIEGTVDTVGELPVSPTDGTTYAVGLTEPRNIYIYDTTNGWVNQGTLKGLDGTSITSVTSSKVGFTTTVTIDGTFDNAPYSFDIEDGNIDAYTKTEVQTALPVIGFIATNTTSPTNVGQMAYNQNERTMELNLGNGVMLQVGQESLMPVRNTTTSTITNLTPCMITGSLGNSGIITVSPMDGTVQANYTKYKGIATENIGAGADGLTTFFGKVRGVDTSMFNDGDLLYISTTVIGGITNVKPTTGMCIKIGEVVTAHTNGSVIISPATLDENLYVQKVTSTDNAVPRFNGTNGELKNSNLIVDDKGNIGVGVTPKNWDIDANMQALDFGNNAIMANDTSISTMQNCYFSESTNAFKYTTTGTASISYLSNGLMVVRTAPSGAADTDITFTTILTIHPNGGIQLPNANTTNNLLLHWVERATATLTLTGFTTTVTTTARFQRIGNEVHLSLDSTSGTSNATTLTITGVPLNFRPTANRSFTLRGINNGSQLPTPALAVLTTDGTSILYSDFGGGSWASSGAKGIYTFEASYSI